MTRAFIIAEAGVNHNGSIDNAHKLIELAQRAGADAVKFQTFKTSTLLVRGAPKAHYQTVTTGATETQEDMLKRLEISYSAHFQLKEHCETLGIEFLSTPFDCESLRFLVNEVGVKRIKIPSGEITNGPLLWEAGHTGLPVILSTGMSTLSEIEDAVAVLAFAYLGGGRLDCSLTKARATNHSAQSHKILKEKISILHCTSEYPAPLSEINLNVIPFLREKFDLAVGYSDHTLGSAVSIGAIALGASIIEKHFTLDKSQAGPDHQASLTPEELCQMIKDIRSLEQALGTNKKSVSASEGKNLSVVRKSLVAQGPIKAGELFSESNVVAKRPGTGVTPMHYWDIIGKPAPRDFSPDELIQF